jgi:hypothetical protein
MMLQVKDLMLCKTICLDIEPVNVLQNGNAFGTKERASNAITASLSSVLKTSFSKEHIKSTLD